MKNLTLIFLPLTLAVSLPWACAAKPSETETNVSTGVGSVQSVFVQPASAKDGRDPFFPESARLAASVAAAEPAAPHTVEISSLRVPGILGTPGHWLAVINNHTFAEGDEGEVLTADGRVDVLCLEIQADHVLVKINGQVHRLNPDLNDQ